ncbi:MULTISPECIES: hypothetical protein [unclassified Streptomyces]|uniref:hypothetical protein n=1 Tax=unclassified Streptomyces TaxID=2593676 RepID=UPI002E359656|nr:hypothetical protein [Streptomyces sp. NBC_01431]
MSPFRRFAVATSATVPLALAGIALATPAQAADSGGLDGGGGLGGVVGLVLNLVGVVVGLL